MFAMPLVTLAMHEVDSDDALQEHHRKQAVESVFRHEVEDRDVLKKRNVRTRSSTPKKDSPGRKRAGKKRC